MYSIDSVFDEHNISIEIRKAIKDMGFLELTDIQAKALSPMMNGDDIIALAPTGTGKTLAFSVPMLEYVNIGDTSIQELVLCPTRELAIQIADEITKLSKYIKGLRVSVISGGVPIKKQIARLKSNIHIIVGTPGRVLDLSQRNIIDLRSVHTMILDEADEMFNMGFVDDVCKIIEMTSKDRQLALFSATMSRDVMTVAWKYLYEPVEIKIESVDENKPQIAEYTIETEDKNKAMMAILKSGKFDKVMIFTNTKLMCERLYLNLNSEGYSCEELHGNMKQSKRNRVMDKFKSGKFPILVATDVAARGLDIDDVEAVINYDLPNDNEYYIHRIGRTGRARKHGVAFSLLNFREKIRMESILKYINVKPIKLTLVEGILEIDGKNFFEII